MNAIPHLSTHCSTCAGERSTFTPKLSKTSADPHAEETLRLPAFATVQPHAADRTTDAVLILMVSAPSPPVPTISRSFVLGMLTELQALFMARTIPAISSGVSFRARRRVRRDETWIGSAPARIAENAASVSSEVRWRSPSMRVWMNGLSDDADILSGLFSGVGVGVDLETTGCGLDVVAELDLQHFNICYEYIMVCDVIKIGVGAGRLLGSGVRSLGFPCWLSHKRYSWVHSLFFSDLSTCVRAF